MSDFFTGQILIFILLLPVLLRPFFRTLQRFGNIPLLTVIAVLICFGLVLSGRCLLFIPTAGFTAIVFLSQTARIVSIARGLPTDYFGTGIKIFYALLIPVFAALIAASVIFIPEAGYIPGKEVHFASVRERISTGFKYDFSVFSCSDNLSKSKSDEFLENIYEAAGIGNPSSGERTAGNPSGIPGSNLTPVVLFFPGFPSGRTGRDTLAGILAEDGFTFTGVQWEGQNIYRKWYLNNKYTRNLYEICSAAYRSIFVKTENPFNPDFVNTHKGLMHSVIRDAAVFASRRFGSDRHLYAVAEGYACQALAEAVNENPGLFTGTVYLIPEKDLPAFEEPVTGCSYLAEITEPLPSAAESMPGLVITGSSDEGFGFGETAADDPALAAILGMERDDDRKTAQLTSRHISSWLKLRHPLSMNTDTQNNTQEDSLEHTGTD